MSKKKKKNSNYNTAKNAELAEQKRLSEEQKDRRKNIIIYSVLAVVAIALVTSIVLAALPKTYYVEMDFGEYGTITIELDDEVAPKTVRNFRNLVKKGFYDGLDIFRAQKKFVIQGGKDDSANLTPIEGEFTSNGHNNTLSHTKGVISMARTPNNPNSATSQFFIVLDDSAKASLDGRYAGFGKVIEGMDVVEKIAEALYPHALDSMGFVDESKAITIVRAKAYTVFK